MYFFTNNKNIFYYLSLDLCTASGCKACCDAATLSASVLRVV